MDSTNCVTFSSKESMPTTLNPSCRDCCKMDQDPNSEGNSINRISPRQVTESNGQLYNGLDRVFGIERSQKTYWLGFAMQVVSGVNSRASGRLYHTWPTCGRWSQRRLLWEKTGESTAQLALKQSSTDRPGNPVPNPLVYLRHTNGNWAWGDVDGTSSGGPTKCPINHSRTQLL